MTVLTSPRGLAAPHSPLADASVTWAGRLARQLLAAIERSEDRRNLHALSDHMLRDIGLERDQIDDVLRGAIRRP